MSRQRKPEETYCNSANFKKAAKHYVNTLKYELVGTTANELHLSADEKYVVNDHCLLLVVIAVDPM